MNIKQISALGIAIISTLTLSACSGGAKDNYNNVRDVIKNPQQVIDDGKQSVKDRAEQAAEDALKKAEDEAKAKAKEAADKLIQNAKDVRDDARILQAKGITSSAYPIGQIDARSSFAQSSTKGTLSDESRTQSVVYNMPYSIVYSNYDGKIQYDSSTGQIVEDKRTTRIEPRGLRTDATALPTAGSATYIGKAFNGTYIKSPLIGVDDKIVEGKLDYTVDFAKRSGAGSITGLGDAITLDKADIKGNTITGTARQAFTGSYELGFFGKNAEEVAGKVVVDGRDTVGFGGTRGEIK